VVHISLSLSLSLYRCLDKSCRLDSCSTIES
jgi:hypothetical protein